MGKDLPDLWTQFSEQSIEDVRSAIPTIVKRWVQYWKPASALIVGLLAEELAEALEAHAVATMCIEPAALLDAPPSQPVDLVVCVEACRALPPQRVGNAVAHLCQWSHAIIFSYHPFEGVSPGYWAAQFAHQGFFHDLACDASALLPWAACYCKANISIAQVSECYENHLWAFQREAEARRQIGVQQRRTDLEHLGRIAYLEAQIEAFERRVENAEAWRERWEQLEAGIAWPLVQKLQDLRARLTPPGSAREHWLEALAGKRALLNSQVRRRGEVIPIAPVSEHPPAPAHTAAVDIIICVHNALEDVQRCLASVVEHTTPPYRLILVDDGSAAPTRDFLAHFAAEHGALLLHSKQATGYTLAANRGLRAANAEFALLLNSDTLVTPRWLDRMVACAAADARTGLVGPLSNTASWQSIPEIAAGDDWAQNPLPPGMTVAEMGDWVAKTSARLYPHRPLLNGFCLLLRREMLAEVGLFDEETFGAGYGEEDDLALRARAAGWKLALADDVYIYHAQSRSYSAARRRQLADRAGEKLRAKHGNKTVESSVAACVKDRVAAGIRARARVLFERREVIRQGRARFAERTVLFVLPVNTPGGGANIVISEAQAMQAMGVNVKLFNLPEYQRGFECAYPNIAIPSVYGTREDLPAIAARYDAVIATYNPAVAWLEPIAGQTVRAYYVQGFEPLMYEPGTDRYRIALASYTLFSDLQRFTKTEWTRRAVYDETGAHSTVVGPSFELDLFRPRPRQTESGLLRIAAMIRPDSPYRAPEMTMRLLQQATERYPRKVEAWIFGTTPADPLFQKLPRDFGWRLAGILSPWQVANFLNETDIFVDFSAHQAMGLTAMEAMGCGNAVIAPLNGGATSFARHERNGLVVDTASESACWAALERLIVDDVLRHHLQANAIDDICVHFPERAAFNALRALFRAKTR